MVAVEYQVHFNNQLVHTLHRSSDAHLHQWQWWEAGGMQLAGRHWVGCMLGFLKLELRLMHHKLGFFPWEYLRLTQSLLCIKETFKVSCKQGEIQC